MEAYERLLQPENLNYAWIKAKNLYRNSDGYVDVAELAAFELDLEQRLQRISRQFERGSYRLAKLRPLPRPKKLCDDAPVNRQYYHVSVDDQVAWIALANALGPELDKLMPAWSYGSRLYRPGWREKDEERRSTLEIGPYRHASGQLYRKFQHSWPIFRRHITLTARMMAVRRQLRTSEIDDIDQLAVALAEQENLAYFEPGFWPKKKGVEASSDLYHASIDLKQFYPALNIEAVRTGLDRAGALGDPRIAGLISDMLRFRVDLSEMPASALENVEPAFLKQNVKGIPTGLFVAGFLANVAMLSVDMLAAKRILEQRSVAHFRYVDDHTIIADDFDTLCDWIAWYEQVLDSCEIGAKINSGKYDPPSLGDWMAIRAKAAESGSPTSIKAVAAQKARAAAMRDTRIDGNNPTKLMTKTLAQVSAIATTNIHILDDEDLEERLKMLEWLLLADIPEREIRPDTRAAFAAGQIASLAPVLIQEADGLVEAARALACLKGRKPDPKRSTYEELESYEAEVAELQQRLEDCRQRHVKGETALLERCFRLLLQALREHPGKARLFYRIHQYCRVTGFAGLEKIAAWLQELRAAGCNSWADYYAGLSLQIMARGVLVAASRLEASSALRSDIKASLDYLEHVAQLPVTSFQVEPSRETWFHVVGRREFGVAVLQVAELLAVQPNGILLARKFNALARRQNINLGASAQAWKAATGWSSGVWAHQAENILGREDAPSSSWRAFAPHFAFDEHMDGLAARRYPELLPQSGWERLLNSRDPLPESDSGWLREVIGNDEAKRAAAYATRRVAFTRAARSLETPPKDWMTIEEWTANVHSCNPFDPRRSEWTALEITRQILEQATTSFSGEEAMLDRLHPNNVLLPRSWISAYACSRERTDLSWETWRHYARSKGDGQARLREPSTSLVDYRYAVESRVGVLLPDAERRLVAVGRLLVGLLRNDHAAPRIWNLRGNELIFPLPRARWFEALAISSLTTLLIEACLGARPAESRLIARSPQMFGWLNGKELNDIAFDPPAIVGPADLVVPLRKAQEILEQNQLAVAMNQPRQLIPFRLRDFAAASENEQVEGGDGAE